MVEVVLKSQRFREEREADWRRLEALLDRAERGRARQLSADQLLEIPVLYRQALSSLSVARAISLDQSLIDYLESLCTRAYFFVYGARSAPVERIGRFFAEDWPAAVRGLWRETLASLGLLMLGVLVGFLLVHADPDWFYAMISPEMAQGRDPTASRELLRRTLYDAPKGSEGLSIFTSFLFTHNAATAVAAFALGFALCLPTAALILANGATGGALIAVYAAKGLAFELVGWLLIHGVTELFAIVLAGAAGMSIGWAVVFPGEKSRLQAASDAGRRAGAVMLGVVVMLFVAGLLEGFGRQLIRADLARYGIAAASGAVWLSYFYLPRKAGR